MTTYMLLLRHGQSTWNAEGRWQGIADAPLSPLGEQQAVDASQHLAAAGLQRVAASDLQRARKTAEILTERLGLGEVFVDGRFRERDVGGFSGLTRAEIVERYPGAFDERGRLVLEIPDAEPFNAFTERIFDGVVSLAARFPDTAVLVATHGGVIRTLERSLDIEPPRATPNLTGRWFECDGTSVKGGELVVPVETDLLTAPPSR